MDDASVKKSSLEERRDCKPHGNTGSDDECRVDQTGKDEHLDLQFVHQLRLACGSFKVLAPHQADSDTRSNGAEGDDQTTGKSNTPVNLFHDYSFRLNYQKNDDLRLSGTGKLPLVPLVSLADIYQRQHHENKRLQNHDEDVKQGPQRAGEHVPEPEHDAA